MELYLNVPILLKGVGLMHRANFILALNSIENQLMNS
jgi:hypothetical protein